MKNTSNSLPNSIDDLKLLVLELRKENASLEQQFSNEKCKLTAERDEFKLLYDRVLEQLKLSRLKRFGQSSEKQLPLFDEADKPLPPETKETLLTDEESPSPKKRKPRKPRVLPKNLPVEEVLHDIPESDKTCDCGHARHRMGEEITEQLKFIPAKLVIMRHIRPKYGCRGCEDGVSIASMPLLLLPKSIATPELVAQTILSKYVDHIPLYRQEQMWTRLGIDLPRNSCCGWIMKVSELCEPLWKLLGEELLQSNYIQADETPVIVLKSGAEKKRRKGYMWCYATHPPHQKIVRFEYQPSRSGTHAENFLKDFNGYLQTDAYKGYDFVKRKTGIIHLGCMAHARRYFADIVKTAKTPGLALEAIQFFKALYKIEREAKALSFEDRYKIRQEKAQPILTEFKARLEKNVLVVPDQFAIGKAIHYCLNHWTQLTNYLKDGMLSIDNNFIENEIRPFALGRKNWMFKGSPRGAKAGAIFYSLLATCRANQTNPEAYLVKMLSQIRVCKTRDDFRKLLPYHIQL